MANTWVARPEGHADQMRITDEFGTGSHTACGECSNACLIANLSNGTPTYRQLGAIIARDHAARLTDPNDDAQTITDIYQDMIQFEGFKPGHNIELHPYKEWYTTDDLAAVSRSLFGKRGGIIIEVGEAYKLPFMEQGVNFHFCVIGAYDDGHPGGKHFYLLNPDRVPRPQSPYLGDWVSIFDICDAKLCGMIKALAE